MLLSEILHQKSDNTPSISAKTHVKTGKDKKLVKGKGKRGASKHQSEEVQSELQFMDTNEVRLYVHTLRFLLIASVDLSQLCIYFLMSLACQN